MWLVNRTGLGKAKHIDMQNLWGSRSLQVKEVLMKKVGTNVNPSELMTKPPPAPKTVQLIKIMGFESVGQSSKHEESHGVRLVGCLTDVKEKAKSLAAVTAK